MQVPDESLLQTVIDLFSQEGWPSSSFLLQPWPEPWPPRASHILALPLLHVTSEIFPMRNVSMQHTCSSKIPANPNMMMTLPAESRRIASILSSRVSTFSTGVTIVRSAGIVTVI